LEKESLKFRASKDILRKSKTQCCKEGQVAWAIFACFMVIILFDARGIYQWSTKLRAGKFSAKMKKIAEIHWGHMATWGFEEPKRTWETAFLKVQDAPQQLYPRSYTETIAAKTKKARDAALSAKAGADKQAAYIALIKNSKSRAAKKQQDGPKVLLLGDSIMLAMAPTIKKDVVEKLRGSALIKAKVSTGLARPDVFDWREELARTMAKDAYDYLIVVMGTNDSQDFMVGGRLYTYGTKEWVKIYNERLANFLDLACLGSRRVIWLGLPPMQSEAFDRKAARINNWVKKQTARRSCTNYFDLAAIVGDNAGRYASYLEIENHLKKVRTVDGIHITAVGGALVSDVLLKIMNGKTAH
jgi:hypothetical protein